MLSDERRTQLDGIVQKMAANKESDSNIRFVVDDFKKKYESEQSTQPNQAQPTPQKGFLRKVGDFFTSSEQALGNSLGDALATKSGDYANAQASGSQLDDMNVKLGHAIAAGRAQGKDTTKLEQLYQENTGFKFDPGTITPSINKTAGQIYGEGLGTILDVASAGSYGNAAKGAKAGELLIKGKTSSAAANLLSKIGVGSTEKIATTIAGDTAKKGAFQLGKKVASGAGLGYGYDVSQNLQQDKSALKPGAGTAFGATLPFVTKLVGALAKGISGKLSGAGTEVVNRAVNNPDVVGAAIDKYAKAPEARQQLVSQAEDVFHSFANQKNQEYATHLAGLSFDKPLAVNPAETFFQAVKKFGGTIDQTGNLNFGDSALTKADKTNLTDAWEALKGWKDTSPQGFDTLRQNLGNHMKDFKVAGNPRANVVLGEVKNTLTNAMKNSIPGYKEMLATYGSKSEAAMEFAKEFQLSGNAKETSKLNNIMRLFKKDPSVMHNLIDIMGKSEAEKFQNEVSGAILSHWIKPNSVLSNAVKGSAEALGLGASLLAGNPVAAGTAIGTMVASSPRIVGGVATKTGSLLNKGVGTATKRLLTKKVSGS